MTDSYKISDTTKQKISVFLKEKNYPAAYAAIAVDLERQQQAGAKIDHDTLAWYKDAAQINDPNAKTFLHYFVRDYVSDFAKVTAGKAISNTDFQKISDHLAEGIIKGIVDNGSAPDFKIVGDRDAKNATEGFGQFGIHVTPYDWPAYAELAAGVSRNGAWPSATWVLDIMRSAKQEAFHPAWEGLRKGIRVEVVKTLA